ncbi:MAG: helix-turn-helix transcriptional regulator [Nitrospira sp.]|nr:helix-turn-helix transcriptional regulator [Nitrospira sp.]
MMLKAIRVKKGFSQDALAQKAKMSQTFLSHVERGKADPSLSTLKRLAAALGVTVCDLVRDERTTLSGGRGD